MAGNVREWVADWFGYYPYEAQTNPTGSETGMFRVLRGGSYLGRPYDLRCADRRSGFPDDSQNSYEGFRCARDAE
jgi:formylglycine-generating enzyme required for sulfatase activity